jgi:hypothetical protein
VVLQTVDLSESIFLHDVTPPPFRIVVTVNGVDYTNNYVSFDLKERLNEQSSFRAEFFDLGTADRTNIKEGNIVRVYIDEKQIFKGIIQNVEYISDTSAKITALDMGIKLKNRFTTADYRKVSVAANTILNELRSVNLNGAAPFLIDVGTNNITTTIDFRAENTDRLTAIAHLAEVVNGDWWVDWDAVDNDRINLVAQKGSPTSVMTFNTGGSNQNVVVASREKDKSQLWNRVIVLGYGDGTQQITSLVKEDAASQATWGVIEKKHIDRRIRTTAEANALADKILAEHKDPLNRIVLEILEPYEMGLAIKRVNTGDKITINDTDTDMSGLFTCVGKEIIYGEEEQKLVIEAENKRFSYLEEVESVKRSSEDIGGFQQIKDPGHANPFIDPGHANPFIDPTHSHSVSSATSTVNTDATQLFNITGSGTITNLGTTFTGVSGIILGTQDLLGIFCWIHGGALTTNGTNIYFRIVDETEGIYFPNATGMLSAGPNASLASPTFITWSAVVFVPGSHKNHTLRWQVRTDVGTISTFNWSVNYIGFGAHTHNVSGQTGFAASTRASVGSIGTGASVGSTTTGVTG